MNQFIARQPIFTVHKKIYAYELLYRGAAGIVDQDLDGNRATASVLSSSFLTKNIDDISSHRPCFINFTQDLIERDLPSIFPANKIVVEILEDVQPTQKVVAVCQALHNSGYTIALDDFIYDKKLEPLLEIADIVKIDVRLTPLDSLLRTMNLLSHHGIKLLAEKVETMEEFDKAKQMGFSYFQGYFFCRPEKIGFKVMTSMQTTLLRLLAEVVKKDTDIERLDEIISMDVSVTYKLLRFLNSAYFYRLQEVKSVKHAVAYLGEEELRRFVMLVIMSELTSEKPDELVRLVLVRAKFCELLGENGNYSKAEESDLFITGLFSLLDAMLDAPMEDLMGQLPVSDMIKDALLNKSNKYAVCLKVVIALERNDESLLDRLLAEHGVDGDQVGTCYLAAVKYTDNLL